MMVDIIIDGEKCSVQKGTTILQAAENLGIRIPTICHHPGLPPSGNCRLCSVELKDNGRCSIVMSCVFSIEHSGMEVITFNERIYKSRRFILEMLLRRNSGDPHLKELAREYGIDIQPPSESQENSNICILCGLCIRACEAYGNSVLSFINRGTEREVSTPFSEPSMDCTGCGACAEVCPVNFISLEDKDGIRAIWGRKFKLLKCRICGKYFATYEQLVAATGEKEPELLCERCRREEEARIIACGISRI